MLVYNSFSMLDIFLPGPVILSAKGSVATVMAVPGLSGQALRRLKSRSRFCRNRLQFSVVPARK